ncbi:12877_t:CDS:2 [Ambispora gerdemannii]|uniref:12877_t:CDS:1 n=1 Tax=Ambispora gerdemannii TaxID=144530 RepID=A0A9N9CCE4_9GLOM|nr:12877_t:CDS:2 [Ambispora gerdemannii]
MNVEGKLDDFTQIRRGYGKLDRNATFQELLQSILDYRDTGNSRERTLEAMDEMSIKGYTNSPIKHYHKHPVALGDAQNSY